MGLKTVSIIGCGWLGAPLAQKLLAQGYRVKGSTTSETKLARLRQAGIDAHKLLLQPYPEGDLTYLLEADTIVLNIPPKAGKMGDDFHPRQMQYVAEALNASPAQHILYISSTSVYPELSREVAENVVISPEQAAAPALVEAEQTLQAFAAERIVTIVRCGGLMGYERIPGRYVAGKTVDTGAIPVNYLHRDDAVGILSMLVEQPQPGVFNAVAPLHPTREAVYRKSCTDFGYELPIFTEPSDPLPYKVIAVEKLIRAVDYQFIYPDPLNFLYSSGT
ncbi:SDR family NAD(P)-dependent oxidoreductase [Fibrisoma montanum]|uniref:SDR family NAD(P)-dependent oxidoreductase n=1 Tax=Fibrisoma montanum TaxID=2305895 RepID=A0A418MJT2_9BACT|nr:NAD(P)-binding domain-containing protein [Fibrisoma montanum]RIV27603.1 SDR family NAD(P)-dependent oxidoreductase [Fibrisoma montanum]